MKFIRGLLYCQASQWGSGLSLGGKGSASLARRICVLLEFLAENRRLNEWPAPPDSILIDAARNLVLNVEKIARFQKVFKH